jgi:drug/metabolite transporter (DMT)-like permease
MLVRLLLVLISLNTIASQLLLKKGVASLGGVRSLASFPQFLLSAIASPWILLSATLQVIGYALWFVVVTREKLGIAVAINGASFYIFLTLAAWLFFGEEVTPLQLSGIALIIVGVACVAWPVPG